MRQQQISFLFYFARGKTMKTLNAAPALQMALRGEAVYGHHKKA